MALKEGRIESQGTISDALGKDTVLAEEARVEQQIIDKSNELVDEQLPAEESKTAGKLIVAEEIQEGHVSWSAGSCIIHILLLIQIHSQIQSRCI